MTLPLFTAFIQTTRVIMRIKNIKQSKAVLDTIGMKFLYIVV